MIAAIGNNENRIVLLFVDVHYVVLSLSTYCLRSTALRFSITGGT
jgi:hypothetical protein